MLAIVASIVLLLVGLAPVAGYSAKNGMAVVSVSDMSPIAGGGSQLTVGIRDANVVRAAQITIEYRGIVNSVEFVPSTYFHQPLVLPVEHDVATRTIRFAVTSTGRDIPQQASSEELGTITFDSETMVKSVRIVASELLDDEFRIDEWRDKEGSTVSSGGMAPHEPASRVLGETKLHMSHPNPANPSTTIVFDLASPQRVSLTIHDVSGRLIAVVVSGMVDAGSHQVPWGGTDLSGRPVASGVYFYRLVAGQYTETRKLVIVK